MIYPSASQRLPDEENKMTNAPKCTTKDTAAELLALAREHGIGAALHCIDTQHREIADAGHDSLYERNDSPLGMSQQEESGYLARVDAFNRKELAALESDQRAFREWFIAAAKTQ